MKPGNIKYLFQKSNRKQLATVSTMVANVVLGAVNIILSTVKLSLYLGFAGAFNIVLAFGKFYALERLLRAKEADEKIKNAALLKSINKINNCTLICALLFFCFGFVITFFYEDPANYEFWMVIYIAATAFIKVFFFIVSAIVNLRKKNGVQYYVKFMGAAAALISLAITQRAILYYVGLENASILSGVGGIIFSLLATFIALFMIKKASKQKKYLLENDLIDDKTKEEILAKQAKCNKMICSIKAIFISKK